MARVIMSHPPRMTGTSPGRRPRIHQCIKLDTNRMLRELDIAGMTRGLSLAHYGDQPVHGDLNGAQRDPQRAVLGGGWLFAGRLGFPTPWTRAPAPTR